MTPGEHAPAAFATSVRHRLKAEAARRKRPVNQLEREFVLQRFLARVFANDESPWVLKGGTGLLIRLPDARHSQDLDLLHPSADLPTAVAELRELSRSGEDPFTFTVGTPVAMSGGVEGAKVTVEVTLGASFFHSFPIDVSTALPFIARVEHHRPLPVVEVPAVGPLPSFALFPLADQIADKVCAMYQRYGPSEAPSSRYRDLVDLVLITANFFLEAAETAAALAAESTRRSMTLPTALQTPGGQWRTGYPGTARDTALSRELHDLQAALAAAAECLDPLLDGQMTTGTWNPAERRWQESPATPRT